MFGKRRIIVVMLLLSPIFLLPAVRMEGVASAVFFVLGGACIAATNPVTLAMAQETVPGSRSTASSLVMGVSWGIANIAASPIGMLADRIGLNAALSVVALSPLVVVAVMLFGDMRNNRRPPARTPGGADKSALP
jgi:FSR family fosmidomycin resistance protein-like MFS transporter